MIMPTMSHCHVSYQLLSCQLSVTVMSAISHWLSNWTVTISLNLPFHGTFFFFLNCLNLATNLWHFSQNQYSDIWYFVAWTLQKFYLWAYYHGTSKKKLSEIWNNLHNMTCIPKAAATKKQPNKWPSCYAVDDSLYKTSHKSMYAGTFPLRSWFWRRKISAAAASPSWAVSVTADSANVGFVATSTVCLAGSSFLVLVIF